MIVLDNTWCAIRNKMLMFINKFIKKEGNTVNYKDIVEDKEIVKELITKEE